MGLLTEEVEVGLTGSNVYHYEKLGYMIPRRIDKYGKLKYKNCAKIIVKSKDLPPKSSAQVEVKCDGFCNKILTMKYAVYTLCNHNGLYYCNSCASKIFNSGSNNYNWNPNKTNEQREVDRTTQGYKDFVKKVLERDDYTCQCCKKKQSGNLIAHHLNSYNWFVEGRTDETNGITLCDNCHENFHLIYGKGNNTKEQYEEWIGHALTELEKYDGVLPKAKQIYCIEDNKIYDSAHVLANEWNIGVTMVYYACNRTNDVKLCKGKHILWLDEYLHMTSNDIDDYYKWCENKRSIKLICLNTLEVFNSISLAIKKYKTGTKLYSCCHGECFRCGQSENGEDLIWMYYDDYNALSKEERDNLKYKVKCSSFRKLPKIICITTGELFYTIQDAKKIYPQAGHISECCTKKYKASGALKDGTRLQWMYYDDYLKENNLTDDEARKSLFFIDNYKEVW